MRFVFIFTIFANLLLSGCVTKSYEKKHSHKVMEYRLEKRGVTIAVIGDQILIVMPSATVFKPYSATIMANAKPTVAMVADYINSYPNMLVDVNVYTTQSGSPKTDRSLSSQQACALEKALLVAGLDTRVLHAYGRGGTHLVSKASLDWQFNMNYRVEITLEKLYV